MEPNRRRAWGNIIVWGGYLVILAVIFTVNRTVFFWQEDILQNTFYAVTGVAVIAWFIMMLVVWIRKPKANITADERDNEIMRRVNAAAGPVAMTAVAVTALVLIIIYLEGKTSVISPYFLVYIALVNIVVYWLAQAVITLVAYRRS